MKNAALFRINRQIYEELSCWMSKHYDFIHVRLNLSSVLSKLLMNELDNHATTSGAIIGCHIAAFPHYRMKVKIKERAEVEYSNSDIMLINEGGAWAIANAISNLSKRDSYREGYTPVSMLCYRITFSHMSVFWRASKLDEEDLLMPMYSRWWGLRDLKIYSNSRAEDIPILSSRYIDGDGM